MKRAVPRVGRPLAVAIPLATAALLAVQVQLARRGQRLEDDPLALDGLVVPATANGDDGDHRGDRREVLRMVWLGDSTAAGVGATNADRAVPRRVASLLARPVSVMSFAESGARVADVLTEQTPRLRALDAAPPDVVAISVGANDVTHLTPVRRFVRTYESVLDQVPASAKVVLLGVPDMGSMPRVAQPLRAVIGWRGRRMAAAVRRIALERKAGFVDIAEATGRVFRDAPGPSFAGDQYHPSDEGYRVWAEAVAPIVQEEMAHARA